MKKRLLAAGVCIALALTGCGSSSSSASDYRDTSYEAAEAESYYDDGGSDFNSGYAEDRDLVAEEAVEDDSYDASEKSEVTEEEVAEYGSKIIRNASVSLDVKNLEQFADNLKNTVKDYGGYVESMDVNSYDSEYSESRYGYFTVRIPAEKLDDFLNIVKDEGVVTSKSESAEDVTLQYVDIEARISTYEAERDSLMELLDKATSLKDILALRDEIADVNYELDSLQRQLKAMQNKVSYSTVNVNAKESRTLSISGSGEKSYFAKIVEHFIEELEDGLDVAIDLLIFLITRLPLFAILVLVVFIIVKIIQKIIASAKKEKKPRAPKNKKNAPEQPITHFTSNVPPETGDKDDKSQ